MGDVLFFFGVGLATTLFGTGFTFFSNAIVRYIATVSVRMYADDEWFPASFDRTPFGWVQKSATRMGSSMEVMRAARDDPSSVPFLIWWVRVMGLFGLFLAAIFVAAGISRLLGYDPE
jgi:hypothetical protein